MRTARLGFIIALIASASIIAQSPPPSASSTPAATAPALTDVQKLQIQVGLKDVEIWQLKAQNAANEFEKARAALQQYITSVTPVGYQLSDKLDLVKLPDPPKPAVPKH